MRQKKKNAMWSPAHETGAEDGIRFPGNYWLEQQRIIFGAVLEIGILNQIISPLAVSTPVRNAAPFPRLTG